ncbi:tropinone reductase [Rosa sericea]
MAGFNSQRWSLNGMTALVTGGTKGIGFATVDELAGLGATVHTCARNQAQLEERVREWKNKGFKVSGSVCDINSKSEREELIKTVSTIFDGKLNILVNNAATVTLRSTTEYTLEDFSSMMGTNVESPYHLCQLAYPLLKASRNASIVFIASIAGVIALPRLSAYAGSKSALIQISKNLACEWARDNIRTNTVAPWAVNTGVKVEENDGHLDDFRRLIGRTPIRRIAEPNEISSLVTFLCLPAASYINGQVVSVDGGFTVCGF